MISLSSGPLTCYIVGDVVSMTPSRNATVDVVRQSFFDNVQIHRHLWIELGTSNSQIAGLLTIFPNSESHSQPGLHAHTLHMSASLSASPDWHSNNSRAYYVQ
ncbi:unnamed protein product [Protopolystoma xenopodis]|uniref:Uncharacterized protein n=1 Tax=Protopolystoma xenopodis TaxID=117903 RepID=A0A3S5A378_9PLAT|nr:unnamed protein product [Protopolystoma xenopodis]